MYVYIGKYVISDITIRIESLKTALEKNKENRVWIDSNYTKTLANVIGMVLDTDNALIGIDNILHSHPSYKDINKDITTVRASLKSYFKSLQDLVEADSYDLDKLSAIIENLYRDIVFVYRTLFNFYDDYSFNSFYRNQAYFGNRSGYYDCSKIFNNIVKLDKEKEMNIMIAEISMNSNNLIKELSSNYENKNIYGICEQELLNLPDKELYKKLLYGGFKKCNITNESFDLIKSEMPITDRVLFECPSIYTNKDKEYIERFYNYLKPDGLLMLTIPNFALSKNVCKVISKQYKDISIIPTILPQNNRCSFNVPKVTIVCRKKADKELDVKNYERLRHYNINAYDTIDEDDEISSEYDYTIKSDFVPVARFKGSLFSLEEIRNLTNESHACKQFWDSQKVEKIGQDIKNPLLPFTIGQLGLVLVSGCLDGAVKEDDNGHYHVIKGKSIKTVRKESERINDSEIETSTTHANQIKISVFTQDGQYKELV